jgi:hypothetical protein
MKVSLPSLFLVIILFDIVVCNYVSSAVSAITDLKTILTYFEKISNPNKQKLVNYERKNWNFEGK